MLIGIVLIGHSKELHIVTKYNCKKVDFGIVVFLDTSERGVIQIAIIFLVSFRTYIVGTVLTDTLPVSSTINVIV